AHLPATGEPLRHRPAVLRPARGPEPADGLPVTARGHVGLLSEGGLATPRHAEPDLPGHVALHGNPDPGHRAHVPLPGHRPLAAGSALLILKTTSHRSGAAFGPPFFHSEYP